MLAVLLAATVPTVGCAAHVEGPPVSAEVRRAVARQSVSVHGATFMGLRNAPARLLGRSAPWRRVRVGFGVRCDRE
jgi:hypothetical protein